MDEPLGVNPAQRVLANVELTGAITDDHGLAQQAVRNDAAHERPFGGDLDRIGVDLEGGNAEPLQMRPRMKSNAAASIT